MKDVIWFDHLSGRDLQNGAVIDEIRDVFIVNKKLLEVCKMLIEIKDMADGGKPSIANQGQALDGYSELANYRSIIESRVKQAINKAEGREER